jgi:molybdopterin-guanine dinucleotide biosynthesis protein A
MLTGVILAGGQNRRMGGQNKALLSFSNEKLIQRQIRIMRNICDEIILVTNDPRSFLPLLGNSIRIITDYVAGKGPLGGMHAAFTLSKYPDLWVLGCDMPFISYNAADMMWRCKKELKRDAVVPFISGRLHPLHGIYDKNCLAPITSMLELHQYRMEDLFNAIRYEPVGETFFLEQESDFRFLMNINTPEEYRQAVEQDGSSHQVS